MRNFVFILILVIAPQASAGEIVYTPVNPSFGGSPLNGAWMLNNAESQNDFKDKSAASSSRDLSARQSDLDRFNDLLQRTVLNRIASSITSSIVTPDGTLIPGSFETSDFLIEVIDQGGGTLQIVTTDKTTGETTSFVVTNDI